MNLLLDIARGAAALLVFLFHIRDALVEPLPVLAAMVSFGSLGVPMFFVISGYLMTRIISRDSPENPFSAPAFYLARVRRIVPALWVFIAAYVALAGLTWVAKRNVVPEDDEVSKTQKGGQS